MSEEEKENNIVRLEERTRSLEHSDRKHYTFEMILFLALLGVALIFVSGCDIKTPILKNDETVIVTKSWVYVPVEGWEDILEELKLNVAADGKSIEVFYNETYCGTIENSDSVEVKGLRSRLKAVFEESKISVYKYDRTSGEDDEIIGTFVLK